MIHLLCSTLGLALPLIKIYKARHKENEGKRGDSHQREWPPRATCLIPLWRVKAPRPRNQQHGNNSRRKIRGKYCHKSSVAWVEELRRAEPSPYWGTEALVCAMQQQHLGIFRKARLWSEIRQMPTSIAKHVPRFSNNEICAIMS